MVIPEVDPAKMTILEKQGPNSLIFDNSTGPPITMVCGKCGAALVRGMNVSQLINLVLACNSCGAFNETLAR